MRTSSEPEELGLERAEEYDPATAGDGVVAMLARARGGAGPAELLTFYRPYLQRLAIERLDSAAEADALLDELGHRVAESFGEFTGATEAELTAWLERFVAGNAEEAERTVAWCDDAPQAATVSWFQDALGALDLSHFPINDAWAAHLDAALATLPHDEQRAVRLRLLENLPLVDIASESGVSAEVIVGRLRRGLSRLRAVLEME